MTSRSLSQRQLSRSKLSLFLECPRCFYEDVVRGVGRVPSFPLSLNNAVDRLLKVEFDAHRAAGTPHPLFATVGLEAIPFAHADLELWRRNFTGVRWSDPTSGWTLFGAVDDVWRASDGRLIVADYKATAKPRAVSESDIWPGYRQQLEVYQFLLGQQGFEIDPRAWLVYANGQLDRTAFNGILSFDMSLMAVEGDVGWVLDTFRKAVDLIERRLVPTDSGENCKWCQYVSARAHDRAVQDRGNPA